MNKEITIYELLGLIKDGQAPKRIIETQSGGWKEEYILDIDGWYTAIDETTKMNIFKTDRLNNKVKIIEEDKKIEEDNKIEKIDIGKMLQTKKWKRDKKTWQLINELIDEVNKLKESN